MPCRIEGSSRLQDTKGDMDELAHHGSDDDHWRLARRSEPVTEGAPPSGACDSDHGRHVECLAQERMPDLGETWLAAHAAAGFMLSWVKASEGHRLFGSVKALRAGRGYGGHVARRLYALRVPAANTVNEAPNSFASPVRPDGGPPTIPELFTCGGTSVPINAWQGKSIGTEVPPKTILR